MTLVPNQISQIGEKFQAKFPRRFRVIEATFSEGREVGMCKPQTSTH